jgi:hypothetical protein
MPTRLAAVGLIALLGASFGASQFIRTAPAVLEPELRRELGLAPDTLGIVFGLFFVAYARAVGGRAADQRPRRVMGAMCAVVGGRHFVFAAAKMRACSRRLDPVRPRSLVAFAGARGDRALAPRERFACCGS